MIPNYIPAPQLMAVLVGAAVPTLILGRAVLAVVLILAFVCFAVLDDKRAHLSRFQGLIRSPLGVMIVITFVLWLPNNMASEFPLRSFGAISRTFVLVGLLTLLWSVLSSDRRLLDLSLRTLIVVTAAALIFALLSGTVLNEMYRFSHLHGWQSDKNEVVKHLKGFAALGTLMIPILLWSGHRLGRQWLVVATIDIIGFMALISMTSNRSAIAGLVAGVIAGALAIALAYWRRPVFRWLSLGSIITVTVVTIVWLERTRGFLGDITNIGSRGRLGFPTWLIDFQRQEIWAFAFDLMPRSPWFGFGANTINFAPGADVLIPGSDSGIDVPGITYMPSHPHNWLIEILVETGIIGLTSLMIVIVLLFVSFIRRYITFKNPATLTAIAVAAGYWSSGLFNFSFWSAWWQCSFVLILALCLATREQKSGLKNGITEKIAS